MASSTAVALLGLVLEHLDLVAAQVPGYRRLNLDLLELVCFDYKAVTADQHGSQGDLVALFCLQAVDDEHCALFNPVLLATTFYNRIHSRTHKSLSGRSASGVTVGTTPTPASSAPQAEPPGVYRLRRLGLISPGRSRLCRRIIRGRLSLPAGRTHWIGWLSSTPRESLTLAG